ncbi:type III-B CRISPR module-associated Cmr3 family protein [Desulfosoma caldarium]|uniref:CRISPR-associated Cmr3 family protein n=1 Tax=Desulfosoma caldarium TaxID=610254 RepID=A0A3N1ULF6_9BACT|nr:type III-B CRISPR module-associated Cmr3 family protein [Desulfosoma caldarium]ROQ92062.1 CRISPR-associated Cmr3 family protein [Desulfosoma caldarium]
MTVLSITPVDVLMFRGNRLFGGAVHGEAPMPPWPSVVTGAVVSRALVDQNLVGRVTAAPDQAERLVQQALGRDFHLRSLWILSRNRLYCPAPADLVITGDEEAGPEVLPLKPRKVPEGLCSSYPLEMLPILEIKERKKLAGSVWLQLEGWKEHLQGKVPQSVHVTTARQLWAVDHRLGIALDGRSRTVIKGAIYTTDAVALKADTHLVAVFSGSNIPTEGLVRLGGDGRAAEIREAHTHIMEKLEGFGRPQPGWRRFRMILATPGLFPSGWLPPGVDERAPHRLRLNGLQAKLLAAVVPRPQVISGWDLAKQAPKPAQTVVPAGACYWFEVEEGDSAALEPLYERGLWDLMEAEHPARRRQREGWNHVWFGQWV